MTTFLQRRHFRARNTEIGRRHDDGFVIPQDEVARNRTALGAIAGVQKCETWVRETGNATSPANGTALDSGADAGEDAEEEDDAESESESESESGAGSESDSGADSESEEEDEEEEDEEEEEVDGKEEVDPSSSSKPEDAPIGALPPANGTAAEVMPDTASMPAYVSAVTFASIFATPSAPTAAAVITMMVEPSMGASSGDAASPAVNSMTDGATALNADQATSENGASSFRVAGVGLGLFIVGMAVTLL
ncbi:hypothetical protein BU23DRAFT_570764 [Bimuria novae-zelandiae CBS 107.79]|uniref:Uncharacterized protein n=1 Tax=Bimuria novae-zelandiae CBS 107.79 TaxID=1447943 RepID=A0A6A5UZD5_9PLEO|nr:hypothetical protein BU23DRAFT_570764 [Bimuria novae-zelandiae CBS 107.79]